MPSRSLWLVALFAFAGSAQAAVLDRVVAVVNDDIVTLSEVYEIGQSFISERCPGGDEVCVTKAEREVLDSLVERTLVRQALTKLELTVSAEDVDRAIDRIASDNGIDDRALFREAVESQGVAWEDYREQLTEQLRQMKFTEAVLRPRVVITDDEVKDRYQRSVAELAQPEQVELGAIGVPLPLEPKAKAKALTDAQALVAAINGGELSWDDAVVAHDTLGRGGQMGRMAQSELLPAIATAIDGLPIGEVSAPLELGAQLLLVRVQERVASGVLPLEQVEPRLREAIAQEKLAEERARWAEQTRRRSALRILID